jgi:NADH-quinone oxidoreductase subunit L
MLIPLAILAVLSLIGGWIGIPKAMGGNNAFHHWLVPVFGHGADVHTAALPIRDVLGEQATAHAASSIHLPSPEHGTPAVEETGAHGRLELLFASISFVWAILWAAIGTIFYTRRIDIVDRLRSIGRGAVHRVIANKYYVDEIYDFAFVKNLLRLTGASGAFDNGVIDGAVNGAGLMTRIGSFLTGLFDNAFIDGLVNAVANVTRSVGERLRVIQAGQIQGYLYFAFSLTVIILCLKWIL